MIPERIVKLVTRLLAPELAKNMERADSAQFTEFTPEHIENFVEVFCIGQIGVANDCRDWRARRHRGSEILGALDDKCSFTDRLQVARAVGQIRRTALHEDRGDNVVAARRVERQLVGAVEERAVRRPQMMVRIDDPTIRIDDRLNDLIKPFLGSVCGCGVAHSTVCSRSVDSVVMRSAPSSGQLLNA